MTGTELKQRCGKLLGDTSEKIWSDAEKGRYLKDALRQYSMDTGAFHGTFETVSTDGTGFEYPYDFLSFLSGWDSDERVIVKSSESSLAFENPEYRTEKGMPESLYENDSEPGKYLLYPDPQELQTRATYGMEYPFGVISSEERGTEDSDTRGATDYFTVVTGTGTALYERICEAEEVKDPTALLYYMLYEAYTSDSDFVNAERGAFFLKQYKERVALFQSIIKKNSGFRQTSRFY